jgi:L-seryl-tRNA(Ser) seleniumtransferase
VGTKDAVERCRRDSLYRALRVGKETYSLLAAVLEAYSTGGDALNDIPTYRLLTRPAEELGRVADRAAAYFRAAGVPELDVSTHEADTLVGGGTLPYVRLDTVAVALRHPGHSPHALAAALRRLDPPVLARATGDAVLVDVRSLPEEDLPLLEQAVAGFGDSLAPRE